MRETVFSAVLALSVAISVVGAVGAGSQESNKSSTDSAPLIVTPENLQWMDAPSLPPGAKVAVLEGSPRGEGPFTVRFQFPANYRVPAHSHPGDERITVISGTLYLGAGEKPEPSRAKALPAGSFAVTRAKQPHFAFTREATVVQMSAVGPWGVTYVEPQTK